MPLLSSGAHLWAPVIVKRSEEVWIDYWQHLLNGSNVSAIQVGQMIMHGTFGGLIVAKFKGHELE